MQLIDELLKEKPCDLTPNLGKIQVQNTGTPVKTISNFDSEQNSFQTPSTKVQSPNNNNPFTPGEANLKVHKRKTYSMMKLHALIQREMPILVQLSNIVQSCNSLTDCQILTPLNAFSKTGLEDLRTVSRYFMEQVQPPLIKYLLTFLNYGELDDKFDEFFIWNKKDLGFKVMKRGGIKAIIDENNSISGIKSATYVPKSGQYLNMG
jgi:hypothetical protein